MGMSVEYTIVRGSYDLMQIGGYIAFWLMYVGGLIGIICVWVSHFMPSSLLKKS